MSDAYSIGGIQQVGLGVSDLTARWEQVWEYFGFDTVIFRERAPAALMTHYTRTVEEREALLAVNLAGGGGFEVWQYTSRSPRQRARRAWPGDLGIYAAKLRALDVAAAHAYLSQAPALSCGALQRPPTGAPTFFCRDSDDNLFQIVAGAPTLYRSLHCVGGLDGVIIGCSDIDAALPLYRDLLGYTTVVSDRVQTFAASSFLMPERSGEGSAVAARPRRVRSVTLASARPGRSPFSAFYGASTIELWQLLPTGAPPQSHLLHGRQWGDVGFIHLCFEVVGIDALKAAAAAIGAPCTVDSGDTFGMGEAGGRFAYIEDRDGTLIEFVETHRVRLLATPPCAINVRRRRRPLSPLLLRAMIIKRRPARQRTIACGGR